MMATIEQVVMTKQIQDTKFQAILVHMSRCPTCIRTFREGTVEDQPVSFEKVCLHHMLELKRIGL